jgi:hypothetical protein
MTGLALLLSWFSLALYWASLFTVTTLYLVPTRFAVADLCWCVKQSNGKMHPPPAHFFLTAADSCLPRRTYTP